MPFTHKQRKLSMQRRETSVMTAARRVERNPTKEELRRMLAQAAANTDPRPPVSLPINSKGYPPESVPEGVTTGAGADTP